jgi:hypothetical protein
MSGFSIRYPFFIIVVCLIVCVVGLTSLLRMPVDLFPPVNIPVVVAATFYSGMPPEQMEGAITGQFEKRSQAGQQARWPKQPAKPRAQPLISRLRGNIPVAFPQYFRAGFPLVQNTSISEERIMKGILIYFSCSFNVHVVQ